MSTISLGKLITNIQYNNNYDNYVAAIIDSQSGYEYPKLIRKTTELSAFYGDFTYSKMYRDLIDNDIPVLLLPQLTVASQYNKCTLRVARDRVTGEYILCNPKYGKTYEYDSGTHLSTEPGASYNQVIDFENVDRNDLVTFSPTHISYIIAAIDKENSIGSPKTDNLLIQFSLPKDYDDPSTEVNESFPWIAEYANYWNTNDPNMYSYVFESNSDLNFDMNQIVDKVKSIFINSGIDCINVFDEISEVLQGSIESFECGELVSINNQRDSLLNEVSELDNQINSLNPSNPNYRIQLESLTEKKESKLDTIDILNEQSDIFVDKLYKHIAKSIYTHEFLTEDPINVDAVVKNVLYTQSKLFFDSFKVDTPADPVWLMIYSSIEFFIENKVYQSDGDDSGGFDQLHTLRLALRYKNPVIVPHFTNIPGLQSYSKSFYDNDKISIATENDKLIEFYSKIKGDRGACTKISITPYSNDLPMVYQIDVTNGDVSEMFIVSTIPLLPDKAYYSPDEYKYIESINIDSQLIGLKFYNYFDGTKYLSPDEVDIDFSTMDDDELDSISQNFKSRELPDTSIEFKDLGGELNLDRYIIEYPSNSDIFDTIDVLDDSEWYPDLFLSTELSYGNKNLEYLKRLNDYCTSHKTQALIKIDEHNFTSYEGGFILTTRFFVDEQNDCVKNITGSRLLYFFEDLRIDGINYPCFYPYIPNILQSKFLDIPQDRLIYDRIPRKFTQVATGLDGDQVIYNYSEDDLPIIDGDFLKSYGINYFDYNNLYYNYKAIRELNPSPDFHVIYCTSKISRAFLNGADELINCDPRLFEGKVNDLIRKAKNLLPLVNDVNYTYEFNGNQYNIEVSVTIAKLVNKKFIFNITLNIT